MKSILRQIVCFGVMALLFTGFCSLAFAASGNTVVYVTKTGEKYHTSTCSYLQQSKIEVTLQEAIDSGYIACSRCKPPVLDTSSVPIPTPTPSPYSGRTREESMAIIMQALEEARESPAPSTTPKPSPTPTPTQTKKDESNPWKSAALTTWIAGGAALLLVLTQKMHKAKK